MSAALSRLSQAARRMIGAPAEFLELQVTESGPVGPILAPSAGDGVYRVVVEQGRHCLTPDDGSYYLYFVLPQEFRERAHRGLWLEVDYLGDRYGDFRVQYASRDQSQAHDGLYKAAEQRYPGGDLGLRRVRRSLFPMPDFDPGRTQNQEASFRIEFRREVLVAGLRARLVAPEDASRYLQTAPLPELLKLPGRFYPMNYLFVEITNACNFKCTWCPDEVMDRRRGFMSKERAFSIFDEVAAKRSWLGPLYPVKLHQMGEPMLHPELPEIVAYAESSGVPIELNTNCGLITEERIDALYRAGLTNLILSYQTPDSESFKTRKAPRIAFPEYRERVRLAVERKLAMRARTNIEIDIMNTKHVDGMRIVSEDEQALAFVRDWIEFCQSLETKYGLPPRPHDAAEIRGRHFLDQDENGSRYPLLDGVTLIWKRCHTWGNVIGEHELHEPPAPGPGDVSSASVWARAAAGAPFPATAAGTPAGEPEGLAGAARQPAPIENTYCPAPYDQFVVHWNGDVVACCTDYEGRTKHANVFSQSIESIWMGETLKRRKRDMLAGRLLDVCAKCQGRK